MGNSYSKNLTIAAKKGAVVVTCGDCDYKSSNTSPLPDIFQTIFVFR